MNLNVIRLAPVTAQLKRIGDLLERMVVAYELELAEQGIHVRAPQADTSGPEPQTLYSDEEMDALRDELIARGRYTASVQRVFEGAEPDEEQ